jgi:branched-subunit amino acid aminotransferase/4-amino-4-deoxychorismate lyase
MAPKRMAPKPEPPEEEDKKVTVSADTLLEMADRVRDARKKIHTELLDCVMPFQDAQSITAELAELVEVEGALNELGGANDFGDEDEITVDTEAFLDG